MRGEAVTVAFEKIELGPIVDGNETHVDAPGASGAEIGVEGIEMPGSVTVTLLKVVFPVLVIWKQYVT